jgi:hypothetical protein
VGFFSRTSSRVKALNQIALGYQNAIIFLDKYDETGDESMLEIAAWYIYAGITVPIRAENLGPQHETNVMVDGQLVKMQMSELFYNSYGRLENLYNHLPQSEVSLLKDIANGGESFKEIDAVIPDNIKIHFR